MLCQLQMADERSSLRWLPFSISDGDSMPARLFGKSALALRRIRLFWHLLGYDLD